MKNKYKYKNILYRRIYYIDIAGKRSKPFGLTRFEYKVLLENFFIIKEIQR